MFEFLLVLSIALLGIVIAAYRFHPAGIFASLGVFALIAYGILSVSTRSLIVIFPILLATWLVCRWQNVPRTWFAGCAALSIAAGWGVAMLLFIPRWNEIQQLAVDYPVELMDERLAYERHREPATVTPSDMGDAGELDVSEDGKRGFPSEAALEEVVGWNWHRRGDRVRSLASLEETHDSFVGAFVSQEGFGWIRMRFVPPRDEYIRIPELEPLALAPPPSASVSAETSEDSVSLENTSSYREYHGEQALDFVNPKRYGYPIDGEWDYFAGRSGATRARGFEPHAFSTIPEGSPAGDEWQLARLELVSLLKHDPPAVYESEHLPRMRELSRDNAPTRPLDEFETRSLERLRQGETIVAEERRNRITMLGGLRAARQCLQCHSVKEGHLLGAFSYDFFRKEPRPSKEEKPDPPEPVT